MTATPILAVGSIALDTIETPQGQRRDILGGSATFFGVAAALFAPVRLVGVVGSDYPEAGWQLLRSRGIDVSDVQRVPGATFRWGGRYTNDLNDRETLFTELGVFENFEPVLSDQNRRSEIVYLGNIQPSLQLAIRAKTPGARRVISDTMNLWINQNAEELNEVLSKTDILLI
ncbi:MAG: sugar kinase, partial [Candidatus Neomarinimicrobiota bacterium]